MKEGLCETKLNKELFTKVYGRQKGVRLTPAAKRELKQLEELEKLLQLSYLFMAKDSVLLLRRQKN